MRISKDDWAMAIAMITTQRSTCSRRHVGCVLLDVHNHILSTGYNGVASGLKHCNENCSTCPGLHAKSGTNLDGCEAIHAEQNAMLQVSNMFSIDTCYTTTSPCMTCMKMLLNTSCHTIHYIHDYDDNAKNLWISSGRKIIKFEEFKSIKIF